MPFRHLFYILVGLLGIEPRSYAPHAQIIPLYDSPPTLFELRRGKAREVEF